MSHRSLTAIISVCFIAACSSPAPESAEPAEATTSSDERTSVDAPLSMDNAVDSSAVNKRADAEEGKSRTLEIPLTPGVYVRNNGNCDNPANANWRVWDGEGLSGSATLKCRAEILSRDGDSYTIRNSCENTYNGSRTPETLTMTVTDQVHFSLGDADFRSCSMGQVPPALREKVIG